MVGGAVGTTVGRPVVTGPCGVTDESAGMVVLGGARGPDAAAVWVVDGGATVKASPVASVFTAST